MPEKITHSPNDFPVSTNLVDILHNRATNQLDKCAFIFLQDGENQTARLTYKELDRQAQAIAFHLQSLNASGSRALLLYPPGLEFICAFLGCLYAKVIAVPAYPPRRNQKVNRLKAIIKDAEATLCLTTASELNNIQNTLAQDLELASLKYLATDYLLDLDVSDWKKPTIGKQELAFLQYTSGSTGKPKGVMISHANLIHNSNCIKKAFELTSQSVSVTWLPSFHDMGLIDGIIQPLYTGFLGVIMSPVSFLSKPIRWLQKISDYRATHCGGPNFAYELCINKISPEEIKSIDLSSWISAYNGAEPIRKKTLKRFAEKFHTCGFCENSFYPCYGMAESTLMVSGGLVQEQPVYCSVSADALFANRVKQVSEDADNVRHLVGSGRKLLNTKIAIVDPQTLASCDADEVGEIWVSNDSVAQGYWNKPELTKTTFQAYLSDTNEGPFLRTGDLGFLQNGELFVTGRIKDLIIIRGRNHYPQDIELTVEKSHPALRINCGAAFTIEVDGEERLIIAQEVKRVYLRKLKVDEVVGAIRKAVSEQHQLRVYSVLLLKTGSIPKTSSGKIQRYACRQNWLSQTLTLVGEWKAKELIEPANIKKQITTEEFTTEISSYAEKIGDLELTLAGGNHKLDEFLRQTSIVNNNENSDAELNQYQNSTDIVIDCKDSRHPKNHGAKNHGVYSNSEIESWIEKWLSRQVGIETNAITRQASFADYGMDSILAVELVQTLEDWLGIPLEPTILWNFPTIESFTQYLVSRKQTKGENYLENSHSDQDLVKDNASEVEKLSPTEIETSITEELVALEKLLTED